MIDMIDC